MKKVILFKSFFNNVLLLKASWNSKFIFCYGTCHIKGKGSLTFKFKTPKEIGEELITEMIVDISLEEFSSLNEMTIYNYYLQAKKNWIEKYPELAKKMWEYHRKRSIKWEI